MVFKRYGIHGDAVRSPLPGCCKAPLPHWGIVDTAACRFDGDDDDVYYYIRCCLQVSVVARFTVILAGSKGSHEHKPAAVRLRPLNTACKSVLDVNWIDFPRAPRTDLSVGGVA